MKLTRWLALVALVFTVCFLFRKENMRKKG